ncbi:hypothetical protein LUZ60_006871 [Juncus effusus]|nr:hypothetical protein LUZ60_006871 [Juncus effusus]
MAVAGLYRRILPSPPAIEFASSDGKRLFSEALQNGTMEGFFRLVSYFQTQSEPAYCGLASLCVVLNALSIDPKRKWKGPWRWFDESMLDCCEPLDKVKAEGITFNKVACLAHCAGARVEAFRADESNVEEFRKRVVKCASSEDEHLIASYHRSLFKQTGTGHFSPIGGYNANKDMVLILDVARFKYPPHWVPLSLLWDAINTIDEATRLPRGFILISRLPRAPSLLYTLSCKHENWAGMVKYLTDDVPKLSASENIKNIQELISELFKALPESAGEFIKWVVEVRRKEEGEFEGLNTEEEERLSLKEEVLQQVRSTKLYQIIKELLSCQNQCSTNTNTNSIQDMISNLCCQGAALLTGSQTTCCKNTRFKQVQTNKEGHGTTILSGTVVNSSGNEQNVDVLVPNCSSNPNCSVKFPASNDVLSVLILSLPIEAWAGIKDRKVFDEMRELVCTESLPELLQWEILHLRKQLLFLRIEEKESVNDHLLLV